MASEFVTALLPFFSGAALGAIGAFFIGQKKIQIENITMERKNWRADIRKLAKKVNQSYQKSNFDEISLYEYEFQLKLNPVDPAKEDQKILECLKNKPLNIEEFNGRVAYLLKHDWERAKWEASMIRFPFEPMRKIFPVKKS